MIRFLSAFLLLLLTARAATLTPVYNDVTRQLLPTNLVFVDSIGQRLRLTNSTANTPSATNDVANKAYVDAVATNDVININASWFGITGAQGDPRELITSYNSSFFLTTSGGVAGNWSVPAGYAGPTTLESATGTGGSTGMYFQLTGTPGANAVYLRGIRMQYPINTGTEYEYSITIQKLSGANTLMWAGVPGNSNQFTVTGSLTTFTGSFVGQSDPFTGFYIGLVNNSDAAGQTFNVTEVKLYETYTPIAKASVPDETSEFRTMLGWIDDNQLPYLTTARRRVAVHFDGNRKYRVTQANFVIDEGVDLNGHGATIIMDTVSRDDNLFMQRSGSTVQNWTIDPQMTGIVYVGNHHQYLITTETGGADNGGVTYPVYNTTTRNITILPSDALARNDSYIAMGGTVNATIENIYFKGSHLYMQEGINLVWGGQGNTATSGSFPALNATVRRISADYFKSGYPAVGGGALIRANGGTATIEDVSIIRNGRLAVGASSGDYSFTLMAEPSYKQLRPNYIIRNVVCGDNDYGFIEIGNRASSLWFSHGNTFAIVEGCVGSAVGGDSTFNGIELWNAEDSIIRGNKLSHFANGINVEGYDSTHPAIGNRIYDNTTSTNTTVGIRLNNTRATQVVGNTSYGNGSYGIRVVANNASYVITRNILGETAEAVQDESIRIDSDATNTGGAVYENTSVASVAAGFSFGSLATYVTQSSNHRVDSYDSAAEGLQGGLIRWDQNKIKLGVSVTPGGYGVDISKVGLRIGADDGANTNSSRTVNTEKDFQVFIPAYGNGSDIGVMGAQSTISNNTFYIGSRASGVVGLTRVFTRFADAYGSTGSLLTSQWDNSARFAFGTTNIDTNMVFVVNSAARWARPEPTMTTSERNAASKSEGGRTYDSTLHQWFGYDGTSDLTFLNASGLTAGRVPYASDGDTLADDADLTFSGDMLTVTKVSTPTIELGSAATDTTVTRSAAGVMAVEGIVIPNLNETHPTTTALTYSGTNVTLTASSRATYNRTLTLTNNVLLTITTTDGANGIITLKPDASTPYTVYLDSGIRMQGVAASGSFVVTNSASETVVIAWQAALRGASAFTAATKGYYP